MSPPASAIVRLLSICALILTLALTASAQSELISSSPEPNTEVTPAPGEVILYFSQVLDPVGSTFTVTGPDGTPVSEGQSEISMDDQTSMRVSLQPDLAAGTYTVNWTSMVTEDGSQATGSYNFTVGPLVDAVTAPSTPEAAPDQPDVTNPQPSDSTTQNQPSDQLPVTSAEPEPVPSLAIAACLIVVFAGCEIRRRARIALDRAKYADEL